MTRCIASVIFPWICQTLLPGSCFEQAFLSTFLAWDHLTILSTQPKETSPLVLLKQKSTETLPDLILILKAFQALTDRIITDHVAKARFLNNLNLETMTPEHRQACQGLKQEHYDKCIEATHCIWTASYLATSLVKAFAVGVGTVLKL